MAALLAVFGSCAEFLNPKVIQDVLQPGMEHSVKYINGLGETELKDKVNIFWETEAGYLFICFGHFIANGVFCTRNLYLRCFLRFVCFTCEFLYKQSSTSPGYVQCTMLWSFVPGLVSRLPVVVNDFSSHVSSTCLLAVLVF